VRLSLLRLIDLFPDDADTPVCYTSRKDDRDVVDETSIRQLEG